MLIWASLQLKVAHFLSPPDWTAVNQSSLFSPRVWMYTSICAHYPTRQRWRSPLCSTAIKSRFCPSSFFFFFFPRVTTEKSSPQMKEPLESESKQWLCVLITALLGCRRFKIECRNHASCSARERGRGQRRHSVRLQLACRRGVK